MMRGIQNCIWWSQKCLDAIQPTWDSTMASLAEIRRCNVIHCCCYFSGKEIRCERESVIQYILLIKKEKLVCFCILQEIQNVSKMLAIFSMVFRNSKHKHSSSNSPLPASLPQLHGIPRVRRRNLASSTRTVFSKKKIKQVRHVGKKWSCRGKKSRDNSPQLHFHSLRRLDTCTTEQPNNHSCCCRANF